MYRETDKPATADWLEQAIEKARVTGLEVAMRGGTGGPLNTFIGTEELSNMGHHLIAHMRDEERWGEPNNDFEPVDFVTAAYEVSADYLVGEARLTKAHIKEQLPPKMALDIFVDFWLPRIAEVAYGEEYASKVKDVMELNRS